MVKVLDHGGLRVSLSAAVGAGVRVECFVETDAAGDALRYRFHVFGPAGGAPVAMWHRHPGHEARDGGPCHLHRGAGRSPTGAMSFAELTRALRAVLDQI